MDPIFKQLRQVHHTKEFVLITKIKSYISIYSMGIFLELTWMDLM